MKPANDDPPDKPANGNARRKAQKPQTEPHTRQSGVVILRLSSEPTTPIKTRDPAEAPRENSNPPAQMTSPYAKPYHTPTKAGVVLHVMQKEQHKLLLLHHFKIQTKAPETMTATRDLSQRPAQQGTAKPQERCSTGT
ncbi:hypothetical protein BS47DRAFT_1362402 [Hydnum rufescens UP504]|uniref:Uncharacterized protein n=1 Tax=Hydnum rufescens UP504 TaxID=1448309 RepID=A0A9P6AY76_9AGAM|nr:hypothetical protein BS47DRAFT_1362402 [Hydnum rufescens UP504]